MSISNPLLLLGVQSFLLVEEVGEIEAIHRIKDRMGTLFSGIEFTMGPRDFDRPSNVRITAMIDIMRDFTFNTIHIGNDHTQRFGRDPLHTESLRRTIQALGSSGLLHMVIIHGDDIADPSQFDDVGGEVIFSAEILGSYHRSFNTYNSVRRFLNSNPRWKLTLDTAHIMEMERAGEPSVETYLTDFSDRIGSIHLSASGNPYPSYPGYEGLVTEHSLLSLLPVERNRLAPLLGSIRKYPVVLEGVVPDSNDFYEHFLRDVFFLKSTTTPQ